MNLDEQRYRYRALNDWFKTPQGMFVGDAFLRQFSQLDFQVRSTARQLMVLQLGICGEKNIDRACLCTPCLNMPHADLIASPLDLPLQRHSVDIVIAPMLFEVLGDAKQVLDEIDRVLSPMGYAVFLGIQPLSLWGLALMCHRLGRLGQARMTPHSPWSIKRVFLNLGYQQHYFESFYYVPPLKAAEWVKRSLFLNEMGKIMPVFPAGFYCLMLQKYQSAFISTKSQQEPLFLAG